ncbi:MAG: hypothetical protein NTV89_19140, partial [Proteobacteria bacterium]|nr:hypothetical protein [Pseudomonadota bacterium]
ALGWMGLRLDFPALRWVAYLLGLAVLFRFSDDVSFYLEPFGRFTPILNSRFLVCGAAVAGFYIFLSFIARCRDKRNDTEQYAFGIIFIITQVLSLVLLSAEVYDFFLFRAPGHMLE